MIDDLTAIAQILGEKLIVHDARLATVESCTGGLVSAVITNLPGSSNWFECGFVTYSNLAKEKMVGVDPTILSRFGAVSVETATSMAAGGCEHSLANVSLAITGVAGPDGGSKDKPVGTVCFAWHSDIFTPCYVLQQFSGDRVSVREQSVKYSLEHLISML